MLIVITGEPVNRHLGARRTKTFMWLARQASADDLPICFVQPNHITLKDGVPHTIKGYVLNQTKHGWIHKKFRIERAIWIDFMYLKDIRKHRSSYRKLKRAIERSSSTLLNAHALRKDEVYRILSNHTTNAFQIPLTKPVFKVLDVLAFMDAYKVGWLKPVAGSGAQNIVRMKKLENDLFIIHSDALQGKRVRRKFTRGELVRFLRQQLKKRKYLIQEEINLPRLQDKTYMDLRVTVQRDEGGIWKVTSTTLRRSGRGRLVTNYHAGGRICSLQSADAPRWLQSAGLTLRDCQRAQVAALRAAAQLQHAYPSLAYVGMDVAPSSQACHIYDCNSRPGRDILTDDEIQLLVKRLIGFSGYLLNRPMQKTFIVDSSRDKHSIYGNSEH